MRARSFLAKASLAAAVLATTLATTPATGTALTPLTGSPATDEARFYSMLNQVRAAAGAPALILDSGVSNTARAWSQQMAAAGDISHNPNRQAQITGWSMLGENVGYGSSVDILENALVNSPHHYENMVNPDYVLVGVGVAYGNNYVYVTEDFVTPAGQRASAAPDPVPEPAPDPAPAPAPTAPRATTTTAPPEPVVTTPPEPPAPPAPSVTPAQLGFVFDQLREWTADFFPGGDSGVSVVSGRG